MNNFQSQFLGVLGAVLGAKKMGTPNAPTPKSPSKSPTSAFSTANTEYEGSDLFRPTKWENLYSTENKADKEVMELMSRLNARQKSNLNLYNRHEALRSIRNQKQQLATSGFETSKEERFNG